MAAPREIHPELVRLANSANTSRTEEPWLVLLPYVELLLQANRKVNLVGTQSEDEVWSRHILDALSVLPLLTDLASGSRVIDIGSGAGLPGIPLALFRPDLSVTLLEATGRKADFLRQTVRQLDITGASVENARAEDLGRDPEHREHYDLAISRAVAPLPTLLEYSLPLVRVGGHALAMKGRKATEEMAASLEASKTLGGGKPTLIPLPGLEKRGAVAVRIAKDRPTPSRWPRPPGRPAKEPL